MHEADIVSLDVFKNEKRTIAATGAKSKKGSKLCKIYVWDMATKETLACLEGFHLNAVTWIRFSPNGEKLLTIGADNDNSIAIYDWKRGKLLATAKVDKCGVSCAIWDTSDYKFATCGKRHIKFWEQKGKNLPGKRGKLE
jgi:microtubule-associated protein-like 6